MFISNVTLSLSQKIDIIFQISHYKNISRRTVRCEVPQIFNFTCKYLDKGLKYNAMRLKSTINKDSERN